MRLSHCLSLVACRGGKVSREQVVSVPGAYLGTFTRIGLVEALSSLLGFVGAANLPGRAKKTCRDEQAGGRRSAWRGVSAHPWDVHEIVIMDACLSML